MLRTKRAFTFIELLIVLVIIGIAARFVLLNVGPFSSARQIELKTEHLANYFAYLQQQAILDANPVKLVLLQHTFHEFRFDANRKSPWHEVVNNLTREIQFPEQAILTLEGQQQRPEVIFYPDGAVSSFQLSINNKLFHPTLAFQTL